MRISDWSSDVCSSDLELDAYGAARDQRFAVERAKQEGAPLADDMGEPATFDDIIANSPPAHAYDDWTNTVVSKVGNIRVDKLESPQDIGQALKKSGRANVCTPVTNAHLVCRLLHEKNRIQDNREHI